MSNPYVHALLRFKWLLLVGAIAGVAVAAVTVLKPAASNPLHWKHRTPSTYSASTQLLVDSHGGPYLRADNRTITPRTAPTPKTSSQGHGATTTTQTTTTPTATTPTPPSQLIPNTHALVQAANLYPMLIQSASVAHLRDEMFGPSKGRVTAQAIYSLAAANHYRPSSFPVINITATAKRPKAALVLSTHTARAFIAWLKIRQKQEHIPPTQRIIIRELQLPSGAALVSKASLGLPIIAGFMVFLAVAGLAVVLDRLRPMPGYWQQAPKHPVAPVGAFPSGDLHQTLEEMRLTLARLSETATEPSTNGHSTPAAPAPVEAESDS